MTYGFGGAEEAAILAHGSSVTAVDDVFASGSQQVVILVEVVTTAAVEDQVDSHWCHASDLGYVIHTMFDVEVLVLVWLHLLLDRLEATTARHVDNE